MPDAAGLGVPINLQRLCGPVCSPPGEAVGGEPVVELGDVLQAAGRQEAVLPSPGVRHLPHGPAPLPEDPVRPGDHRACHSSEPLAVAGEQEVLGDAPEHTAVVLIVVSLLETAGTIVHAVEVREVPRLGRRALVFDPEVQAPATVVVKTALVQFLDNHAGLIAEVAVSGAAHRRVDQVRRVWHRKVGDLHMAQVAGMESCRAEARASGAGCLSCSPGARIGWSPRGTSRTPARDRDSSSASESGAK